MKFNQSPVSVKVKAFFFLFFFSFLAFHSFAQVPLRKGDMQLNAGLGFSGWGIPIYAGLEFGFMENITVGGEVSYRSYTDDFNRTNYRHNIFGLYGFGNYHFNELLEISSKQFDVYGGAGIGFFLWNSSGAYKGSGASGLGIGIQIGGRYYFNRSFGLNLELGGNSATSGGKIGITYVY